MGGAVLQLRGMWASPAVHRVAWALRLKGIEYEYVEEDLERKSAELLELNPVTKQVPVLVHDGRPVIESLHILEYIDEVWPEQTRPPLLPKDPYDRARARSLATFVDDKGREAARKVFYAGDEEERNEALKLWEDILRVLEKELKVKGVCFGGENIGYLDLALGWIPYWVGVVTEKVLGYRVMDAIKFPNFASWSKIFLHHPPGDKLENIITLPPEDMAVDFFDKFRRLHLASAK